MDDDGNVQELPPAMWGSSSQNTKSLDMPAVVRGVVGDMQDNFVIADENNDPSARVWDVDRFCDDGESVIGEHLVTFDREKVSPVYNLFCDFPHAFSREQLEILRKERPFWWEFFSDLL